MKLFMNIVFHSTHFDIAEWQHAFTSLNPAIKLYRHNEIAPEEVDILLIWKPEITNWKNATRLKLVVWLGAGIDVTGKTLSLPSGVSEERLKDAGMKIAMCDYAHYAVLHYQRRFDHFQQAQRHHDWILKRDYRKKAETRVGVLGLGHLGGAIASYLAEADYIVSGWSRTPKNLNQVTTYAGIDELDNFLSQCQILINMLPLTEQTHHFLSQKRLAKLPHNAAIISLSRGAIIDTEALLAHIDQGHLRGAFIDVFEKEPLDKDSALWSHPKITITPHQSAPTLPIDAAKEVLMLLDEIE